jgi:methylated-DNA-[protein]-cysteine S-methyltransferase
MRWARVDSPLGDLTLLTDGAALTGVYFARHWPRPPLTAFGVLTAAADDPVLAQAAAELTDYLAGRRTTFDVPTRGDGDEFQRRVWAQLDEIPYGTTTSYGVIADRLGAKTLAQRVGQAVGRNPLSIIVPCHRVIGSDGWLTGYAGGLDRKRWLLELEQPADVSAGRLF